MVTKLWPQMVSVARNVNQKSWNTNFEQSCNHNPFFPDYGLFFADNYGERNWFWLIWCTNVCSQLSVSKTHTVLFLFSRHYLCSSCVFWRQKSLLFCSRSWCLSPHSFWRTGMFQQNQSNKRKEPPQFTIAITRPRPALTCPRKPSCKGNFHTYCIETPKRKNQWKPNFTATLSFPKCPQWHFQMCCTSVHLNDLRSCLLSLLRWKCTWAEITKTSCSSLHLHKCQKQYIFVQNMMVLQFIKCDIFSLVKSCFLWFFLGPVSFCFFRCHKLFCFEVHLCVQSVMERKCSSTSSRSWQF